MATPHSTPGDSPVNAAVEDFEKLGKRGLIHDVDQAHLRDQEVEDRTPGCHWPVLLSSRADLLLRLLRYFQLLTHLLCSCFGHLTRNKVSPEYIKVRAVSGV